MKIISYETGRVTWLFPIEEFSPLGGALAQQLISAIAKRYAFERVPTSLTAESISQNGLKFESGIFDYQGNLVNLGEFIAYSDGIVASTNMTERSEAFLDDIVTWLQSTMNFRPIETPVQKMNLSVLSVELDAPLSSALKPELPLEALAANWLKTERTNVSAVLGRMDFLIERPMSERTLQTPPPRLVIEQRVSTVPEQLRFFSSAPITTKHHVEALEEINKALAG